MNSGGSKSGDAADRHVEDIRRLSRPGQPLAHDAPQASINNPAWFVQTPDGPSILSARQRVHSAMLQSVSDAYPKARQDARAIVLAGPPGAGKSTIISSIIPNSELQTYSVIDADAFKVLLLEEALRDGSFQSWIARDRYKYSEPGERFFPMEHASLVHEESSMLAKRMLEQALNSKVNVIIDTVLSSVDKARGLSRQLVDNGYTVRVIDVEVSAQLSETRIRRRWADAYTQALQDSDHMGGRWVPSTFSRTLFDPISGKSISEEAARILAFETPSALRYELWRTPDDAKEPSLEVTLTREREGARLS